MRLPPRCPHPPQLNQIPGQDVLSQMQLQVPNPQPHRHEGGGHRGHLGHLYPGYLHGLPAVPRPYPEQPEGEFANEYGARVRCFPHWVPGTPG